MNTFTIAGIVGISVIFFGILIAAIMTRLSAMVNANQMQVETGKQAMNLAMTLGHPVSVNEEFEQQLQEARQAAARRAAVLPRGANMGVGTGEAQIKTASDNLEGDPMTAVRIARFHTWQGARIGMTTAAAQQVAAPVAVATAAPVLKKPEDLVPGVDYKVIEITDDMDPAAVRKARIENSKARSAAVKALKESGETVAAPAGVAAPVVAAAAPVAAVPMTSIPEPNYIEITDAMSPDEVRKARIQNSKLRSAYNKALKEAGAGAAATQAVVAAPAAPVAPAPPAAPAPAPASSAAGIPAPQYIEITDNMSADELRRARIENSKMRSAYNKALKAAGIDPASVA